VAWTTPVLRRLDDTARSAVARAGRVVAYSAAAIYREGDACESFFVVTEGSVELHAIRRGDDAATLVRTARAGESFGEEALLPGLARRLTATTKSASVVEIPVAVFVRAAQRGEHADRERRYVERAAARDLLACSAFARDLDGADVDLLLDAVRLERVERGTRIYEPGASADAAYFVVEGLVQLQREDDTGATVAAYLSRGDFFGDQEALAGDPRRTAAVASGDSWCAIVPRDALRTLSDRNPGVLAKLRRVAETREAAGAGLAGANSTQHVFRDLYRMQMARSLLVIDQDTCVRCGHCAWSCEQTHGTSRLIRRGDKIVTGAATLLLPNTCQHCRHAACMIDCPTGAIGRGPEGEVFIRPSLCTGCGNCAKLCPWENIQMALRIPAQPALSADVAVKCDLCRGHAGPACVEACPTGSVMRLDPQRDIAEVVRILGGDAAPTKTAAPATAMSRTLLRSLALAATIALVASGWAIHRGFALAPSHGGGLVAGVLAGLLVIALAAYVVPKRLRAKARPKQRGSEPRPAVRSRLRPHFLLHLGLGAIVPAAALAHAGLHARDGTGAVLIAALAITAVAGVLAALAYALVPPALTRLERRGALPEDLAGERDVLEARLYQAISGASDRLKTLAERILLPYARARPGPARLVASGLRIADERARLRAEIDAALAGRMPEGSDALIELAVELRALPARRVLTALLRVWPPIHAVTGAITLALLVVHVAVAVMR
jgi:Fe-S-cluster-containing dehydrogenase component/CRP-like cAMP-binding protein